jgi:hypothetical protein
MSGASGARQNAGDGARQLGVGQGGEGLVTAAAGEEGDGAEA